VRELVALTMPSFIALEAGTANLATVTRLTTWKHQPHTTSFTRKHRAQILVTAEHATVFWL